MKIFYRLALSLSCCLILLSACAPSETAALPTPTQFSPTATVAPATPTTIPPTATVAPATPTTIPPTEVPPTETAVPATPTEAAPSVTPTPIVVAAVTLTPAPATPSSSSLQPIETATSQPSETPGGEVSAHSYFFPVQDAQVDYGETHHDYPATDIFCAIGSRFVAVTDGVVDFVTREDTWDPATNDPVVRGGISVAIIGDDGVRYYGSHLSEVAAGIEPGVRVSAGQLLGLTGNSGNARSTPPHLHFGISRPTTPDDWQVRRGEIAPAPYLRAWQNGENITPELN